MVEKVQFIPSRLKSSVEGGYVAGARDIVDDINGKSQETINAEVREAIGTGGSVDSRIAAAINALDSIKSQNAGADGLALNIVEENGKITSISGSIAANTYDAHGAAAAVVGNAGSDYNTLKKVEDKLSPIEAAVGSGGSVDSRIAAAKAEIIGNATSACDTLGEAEAKINANTSAISAETSRAQAAEADRYTKSETYTKTEVNGLVDTPHQEYVTVDAYANLPATGSKDTIYRVSNYNGSTSQVDASVYSEYAWNGSQYVFLCVKSQIGEVFDISVYNNNAKYADLAAALNGGANIPQSLQKGGMSVKFVQSSDNKYVQYRLMADEWSADTNDWAIAEEGVYVENPEFVYVKNDNEGKILWAIKTDGGIYYGAGVPQQVVDYINEKVDKEEGKSLIDSEYASTKSTIDNPEFLDVTLDAEDKVLEGIQQDGTKVIGGNINVGGSASISGDIKVLGNMEISGVSYKVIENPEYLAAWVDEENKVVFGLKTDGKTYVGDADFLNDIEDIKAFIQNITDKNIDWDALSSITAVENPEFVEATTDSEGKILAGRTSDGAAFENVGLITPKVSIDGATTENIEDPEGRIEIHTDADNKIISYRNADGVKHEEVGIETNHLGLSEEGMTEFQNALKESGFNPGGTGDWSDYISNDGDNPLCIPQPRNIALVNILSDVNLINLSKSITPGAIKGVTYDVHTEVEFWDMDGNYFKKPALMSGQGNSSMQFPKKNIAFDFFDSEIDGDAFAIKFGDWVPQDSWHLKAYYTDAFRCIGLAAYKLYDEIVKTRGITADYVYKKALINFDKIRYVANGYNDLKDLSLQFETGAKCFPDGFPVIVYQNGVFFGLYCWQIKKHRDNYHMKKGNKKHIHLDGTLNSTTFFNGTINWEEFEVRNPKDLIDMDGKKYNGDVPKELIDSTSQHYDPNNKKHVNTAAVKQYIINFSNVMSILNTAEATYNASPKAAEDLAVLKATFEEYFDADNLIDYLIISDISRNYDGFSKNWQWLTYDGIKWWVGLYDCDCVFGNNFTGTSNILPLDGRHITNSLMYHYITTYYNSELEDRYAELRHNKIIDKDNIIKIINRILLLFGEQNIENEFSKWTNCPCNRDVVLNENWEFDLDENGNPQLGTANYNNSTTYNAGDSCFYAQYPGNGEATYKYKAKATVTGVKPVDSFGYRDSIYRLYSWIKKSIENMDTVYSYNN